MGKIHIGRDVATDIIYGITGVSSRLSIETQIYARIDGVVGNIVSLKEGDSPYFCDYALEFTTNELELLTNDEKFRSEIIEYIRQINQRYPEVHIHLGALEWGNFKGVHFLTNFGLSVTRILYRES